MASLEKLKVVSSPTHTKDLNPPCEYFSPSQAQRAGLAAASSDALNSNFMASPAMKQVSTSVQMAHRAAFGRFFTVLCDCFEGCTGGRR